MLFVRKGNKNAIILRLLNNFRISAKMKSVRKMIAVLAAVCALSTNLSAQELKDEVSVSIGIAPYPYVPVMDWGYNEDGFYNNPYYHVRVTPIAVQYMTSFNHWLSVGGLFVFHSYSGGDVMEFSPEVLNKKDRNVFAFMVAGRVNAIHRDHFSFYAKVALGPSFDHVGFIKMPGDKREVSNEVNLAYQIMPLGFEFGGRRLKGFFETGYGYQGMFITGARYAF